MIPDIKVSRSWFTGIQDALKWSDDGVLAAPSRETVTIFVSFQFPKRVLLILHFASFS